MENRQNIEYNVDNMDSTLKALGGCGRFQVLVVLLVFTSEFTSVFSVMFMTFGLFNPGWRCLDNNTLNASVISLSNSDFGLINFNNDTTLNSNQATTFNSKDTSTNISSNNNNYNNSDSEISNDAIYVKEQCPDFKACQRVEFNPESSTIVSQWNLICDQAWIPKAITSIQMVGVLIGGYINGYLVDRIGRKRTILFNALLNAALNLIAVFSSSWHVFAALRFFIGLSYGGMVFFPFVYCSEMTPSKWRSLVASIPAWIIGLTFFAVVVILSKDWKTIHIVTGVIVLGSVGAILWIPESLRWLIVRGEVKRVVKVAKHIASVNNKQALQEETFVYFVSQSQREDGTKRKYHWYDLWRKEVRCYTFILGFFWISMAIVYYTTTFGVKNFVGDIYVNLIIMFIIEIPVSAMSSIVPNILGRKWSIFMLFLVTTCCLIAVVFLDRFGSEEAKGTPIFVLILSGRASLLGAWYILYVITSEIYPTIIRGTSLGYGSFMIRIGAIIAPYLIPNDSDSNFISFLLMACLMSICSILLLFLPETKGRELRETWSEECLPLPSTPLESSCENGADMGYVKEREDMI